MGVIVQFSKKGFVMCFFLFTLYVLLTIYGLHGRHVFCRVFIPNNSQLIDVQLPNIDQQILNEEPSEWERTVQNSTTISREFFKYLVRQLVNSPYPGINTYIEYVAQLSKLKSKTSYELLTSVSEFLFNQIDNFSYLIEPQPCTAKIRQAPNIFVAVVSAPSYFEKRNIIRQTWQRHLRTQSNTGSLILSGFGFVVGLTENRDTQMRITSESEMHGDILQINVTDYYYNLTLKAVGLLKWMNDHCSQVDFLLKMDDDVFVNVRNLVSVINTLDPNKEVIYGSRADGVPLRNRSNGKHYISFIDWPWSSFPPYLKGAASLISGRAVKALLAASQTTPYFPFDDVYLSGLCSSKAMISLRISDRFSVGYSTMYLQVPQPCYVRSSITWVTQSIEHFNMSYWATQEFYGNVTQCTVSLFGNVNQTFDSAEVIKFDFTDYDDR